MKCLILVLSLLSLEVSAARLRVLHFNIKELDTGKIESKQMQYKRALEIIKAHDYEFLSLNEVQYDLPKVPNPRFKTRGKNDSKIIKDLGLKDWHSSFNQANTGNNARKKPNGNYPASNSERGARDYADQVNFGIYPGQYSTMGLSKYPIIKETVIDKIKWKTFNPDLDLSRYAQADGKPLPEDMPLFDKNFTHLKINANGKIVNVILLHTVPSYHFGNMKSPNFERNKDQLRFLEWFLLGKTEGKVGNLQGVNPLTKKDAWIAMGDLNVGLEADAPGSEVLKRLAQASHLWMKDPGHTNESGGFRPKPMKLQLDYIFASSGLKVVKGHVYGQDAKWEDQGCKQEERQNEFSDRVMISYQGEDRKQCYATVDKKYYKAKLASDHFALYAEIEL